MEQPVWANNSFSAPMKICTPSALFAASSSFSIVSLVSSASNNARMRSTSARSLDILQQVALAAHDQLVGSDRSDRETGLDQFGGQRIELGAGGFDFRQDAGATFVYGTADQARGKVVRGP